MRISTKGRYALRLMIELAEHNDHYISLKEIADRQDVSKKYLEQIIPLFNNTDILRATRGALGGYKLSKAPENYTVGEILRIAEGSLAPVPCIDCEPVDCDRSENCPTLPIWRGLSKVINEYLDSITLQDIVDQQKER